MTPKLPVLFRRHADGDVTARRQVQLKPYGGGYRVAWKAGGLTWAVWFATRKPAEALRGAIGSGREPWAAFKAIVAPESPYRHLQAAARKGWDDLSPVERAARVKRMADARAVSRARKQQESAQ